jgi:hypothetical protein
MSGRLMLDRESHNCRRWSDFRFCAREFFWHTTFEACYLHVYVKVVELPMLHPEKFVKLGIDPPKGVLCYGPPGTGKTLLARAVANRTDACFIRVIGSELVQKYVGEGARMVRELFQVIKLWSQIQPQEADQT